MAKRGRPRKEVKSFDEMKDEVLEKVILHMRWPNKFPSPILTHEELAVLWAKDANDVKSKMCICKREQAVLAKLKTQLSKIGITSITDFNNSDCRRSFAPMKGATDSPC